MTSVKLKPRSLYVPVTTGQAPFHIHIEPSIFTGRPDVQIVDKDDWRVCSVESMDGESHAVEVADDLAKKLNEREELIRALRGVIACLDQPVQHTQSQIGVANILRADARAARQIAEGTLAKVVS